MRRRIILMLLLLQGCICAIAQQKDTVVVDKKVITLSEVIIRNNVNVPAFIKIIQNDTTFYKAFRNLHVLQFTSLNDIRMYDKKGEAKASLSSRTKQWASDGCRRTIIAEEQVTGDIYDKEKHFNYYTPELYAGLFFAPDTICGENNIVKGIELNAKGKSGIEKHKEQLKMLFFNPGKAIPGLPFIGNKTAIFDADMADLYDYSLDEEEHSGELCYIFSIKAKDNDNGGNKDKVVIDEMVTWFSVKTMEVLARNYSMSYDAGVYDFDVSMEVEMQRIGAYVVPRLLHYTGNWDVVFKKRENAVFTATLFDFSN
ncbi:MAG: hypothetical protein QM802_06770 [Agriterribacter sp.]